MKYPTIQTDTFYRGIRALIICALVSLALTGAATAQNKSNSAGSAGAAQSETNAGVVNINTATEQELIRLPGVGEARAKAIVDLRTHMGGFKQAEDLMRVRGIGRKIFRKLSPMVTLQGPTTLTAQAAKRSQSASGTETGSPAASPHK